jgi:RNA polymerase sigma-70 factor (ECF subfamily)
MCRRCDAASSHTFSPVVRFRYRGRQHSLAGCAGGGTVLQDEESWVRRAKEGDAGALAYLFETHFERVYRYAFARLRDRAEAEDLTQQVFERMIRSIRGYEPRGAPFVSWLFRIAHNMLVDRVRRARTEERSYASAAADFDFVDPEERALTQLEAGDVAELLEKLSDAQRQVLHLRFAAELNVAETAHVMQRSVDAVKSLQYSALKALRGLMAERAEERKSTMQVTGGGAA